MLSFALKVEQKWSGKIGKDSETQNQAGCKLPGYYSPKGV
jgi:hypothetical protein